MLDPGKMPEMSGQPVSHWLPRRGWKPTSHRGLLGDGEGSLADSSTLIKTLVSSFLAGR